MVVVIAGGSGLLGRALASSLDADGHRVVILTRGQAGDAAPGGPPGAGDGPGAIRRVGWNPDGSAGPWARELEGADAVVNLAGRSIGQHRWTGAEKERILASRLLATRSLVEAIESAGPRPPVLLSSSAVGVYGSSGDRVNDERSPVGGGFLAEVCVRWELEAARAERSGTRVALMRTGLVLAAHGGALPRMLLPFRFLAGGPVGGGEQYLSWIHLADWVGMARMILGRDDAAGPINATAPAPATSSAFAREIGRALGRPSWMPAPAFALRIALGEMADELLLGGQRVVPARALALGYRFQYPELGPALRNLVGAAGRRG